IPTAIFCSNDFSASGASRELIRLGYKIPEDVSVIGIDNSNLLCILAVPELTSIDIYRYNTGKWAYEMLMNRINDGNYPLQKKIIKTKLVIRDSVARANHAVRDSGAMEKPLGV
ncbi:MAG: substrate-binding domain-containing protein, partial [Candidatus Humimicrobiaceae bacterium]